MLITAYLIVISNTGIYYDLNLLIIALTHLKGVCKQILLS